LILRIKLIHENENGSIFEDPGEVLGTAIQPPHLKHIDEAITSLILCGGLTVENDRLLLTKLGRIYVDIPLDIIYCKMLIFSMLMGTYEDILILVCILSQNKNAFRKSTIEKRPLDFFETMTN
jgi:HrpA-like RNA helicase